MRLLRHFAFKQAQAFWQRVQPDVVISVVPFLNHDLIASLQAYSSHVPYVTLMTDPQELYAGFWYSPLSHYFICSERTLYQHILQTKAASQQVFLTSGMLLRPQLYVAADQGFDSTAIRRQLNLDTHLPTAIVSYGGMGSSIMYHLARQLAKLEQDIQVIFLCGKSQLLKHKLETLSTPYPKQVLGYTADIHHYLMAADFFIGKPGPGSVHEALLFGKPLLLHYNSMTLLLEKANAKWAYAQGYAQLFSHPRDINQAITPFLNSMTFTRMCQQVATYQNTAHQEVAAILSTLLS